MSVEGYKPPGSSLGEPERLPRRPVFGVVVPLLVDITGTVFVQTLVVVAVAAWMASGGAGEPAIVAVLESEDDLAPLNVVLRLIGFAFSFYAGVLCIRLSRGESFLYPLILVLVTLIVAWTLLNGGEFTASFLGWSIVAAALTLAGAAVALRGNSGAQSSERSAAQAGSAILIREEQPEDRPAIYALTEEAFRGKPYAGGDEQDVVDRLRAQDALTISLVATDNDVVVGHIAYSPATVGDDERDHHGWYALGPVSVAPARQAEGIGGELIRAGESRLLSMAAAGCILTGDPNYYRRFGFEVMPNLSPSNEPGEYFQVKLLAGSLPDQSFAFHPAFYG